MNEASINTDVSGGNVAIAGAQLVRIENLYVGAAASTEPARPVGPIPPCPYPGLAYFGPQDAARFFGRDKAIEALVDAITKRSFTALVGASGSGKSSVVLAGLTPRLSAQGGWRSTYFRIGTEPDKSPFIALARALEPLTGDRGLSDKLEEVQKLAQKLAAGSVSLTNYIGHCRAANPGKRILLIADQFEEAFTLVPDEALQDRFINALIDAFPDPKHGATPDVCLILTLRADFYNAALRHRPLADKLQGRVENLGPMTRDELREAIVKPADALHIEFEPSLVDAILDDVEKRPGSLPLLQFALREMWGRLEMPLMTRAAYGAIGGVEGALAKRAQAIFDDATQHGYDAAAVGLFRRLFTRLVTLGEGAEDSRRTVAREELGPDAWALAQKLADEDNRLVVTGAAAPGRETVEVVHEALIHNWPALVEWVSRDRAFQLWLRQLKPRLDEWHANPTDEGTLLRGGPLALAEEWAARRGGEVNDEERAFVAASVALRDAEKRRDEDDLKREQARLSDMAAAQKKTARAQQRARQALGAIAAVVLLAAGLFYWQYLEAQSALNARQGKLNAAQSALREQQAAAEKLQQSLEGKQLELKHQHANFLGEVASAQSAQGNVDAALRFAAKGADDDLALPNSTVASTSRATLTAAISQSLWRLSLSGHQGGVTCAAFSPDGSRIVTASDDKTARVWDAATAKEIAVLRGHEDIVRSAAFSPDGSRVVTASEDKTARIWDAATAKEIAVLRGHEDIVRSAAFSPDGLHIVTASADKTARVWDAATSKEIAVLSGHEGGVYSAVFSPDGSHIVTASDDKTARVWDAATAKEIAVLRGHENRVLSAGFSPEGLRIVTASGDATARVWDVATVKEIADLRGHEASIRSAAFSPDGSRIVTASDDKTVRVWDIATAKEIALLRGHEDKVWSAAFSPDGSRIVTASNDTTARVWGAATAKETAVLRGHGAGVYTAAFSPDGSRVVTASEDKTARIWDAATAKEIAVLRGHEGGVYSAAFSPDGSRVVTASDDKTVRVWDVETAKEIVVLRGHENSVLSAAFSPDGSRIVTASEDNTARVWDAATSKEIAVLRGHESSVLSAAFSPDESRIVTASFDETARVWDAAMAKEIAVLRGHEDSVLSAVFSPDGSRVVTASEDKTARIWDAATAKEIAILRGHEGFVLFAAFSPDGSRIVTASSDRTARVWDSATGKEIAILRGHEDSVLSAAFSPDGSRIVTASSDNSARVWDSHFATMSARGLLDEVCERRLPGLSTMTRAEMRLAGYPDSASPINVCVPGR